MQTRGSFRMKIAVEGCAHGELDAIYAAVEELERRDGIKIDLLLCCGDFQAVRNESDLECMACPPKYRSMNTFYKYYSGEKCAPVLTVFIGGNHEATNHMWELSHGGWVAPNIYYLGHAGVVTCGGVRIAGWSGIFKEHDFEHGHFEVPPYDDRTMRSAYHIRRCDMLRLLQISGKIDVMLSHDWPTDIAKCGDLNRLLSKKAFLRDEIASGTLGSPPAADVLRALRPSFWFSAHLHVKYAAVARHPPASGPSEQDSRRAGQLGGSTGDDSNNSNNSDSSGSAEPLSLTRFLALDKCLPGRQFLQVIEIPSSTEDGSATGTPRLSYDPQWLAVVRRTASAMPTRRGQRVDPRRDASTWAAPTTDEVAEAARLAIDANGSLNIPPNFEITAEPYVPQQGGGRRRAFQSGPIRNPQTVHFCKWMQIQSPFDIAATGSAAPSHAGRDQEFTHAPLHTLQVRNEQTPVLVAVETNPDEITLDCEDD